jgi:glycosyltransferase involved in cell wall biosynthesis
MSKRKLFLFTTSFPYGTAETFLENEIQILAERFSEVNVFPLIKKGTPRALPGNVNVIDWQQDFQYNSKLVFIRNFFLFRKLMNGEDPASKSSLLQNIARSKAVRKFLPDDPNAVFYSFWFDDWATILGILKMDGVIPSYIARTHGFDLYTEQRKNGTIPFREFQLVTVSKLFAVSNDGLKYLQKKYPAMRSKFLLSHLGVFDHGENPFDKTAEFTLVSCSNTAAIKRVHLIIEILKRTTVHLTWIHFGDGEMQKEIVEKSRALPANVTVEFKGRIGNAELLAFYQKNPVHLFIQLSESEGGVPVSLQEAAGFGIPLMGTDVGGIPEIINEETGILLAKNFNTEEAAKLIDNFQQSEMNSAAFRSRVRMFRLKHFDASTNYNLFCDELLKP